MGNHDMKLNNEHLLIRKKFNCFMVLSFSLPKFVCLDICREIGENKIIILGFCAFRHFEEMKKSDGLPLRSGKGIVIPQHSWKTRK